MSSKEITYNSLKEKLSDELIYYVDKEDWLYLKVCFSAYCNLEDDEKGRIIRLDKMLDEKKYRENKLNSKDETILCLSYLLDSRKDFCDSLDDEELILCAEYYSYYGVLNDNFDDDKKELFKLACNMKKELGERISIVQLGENILNDKDYGTQSVSDVTRYIKNMSNNEIVASSIYYLDKNMNSKEMQTELRRIRF